MRHSLDHRLEGLEGDVRHGDGALVVVRKHLCATEEHGGEHLAAACHHQLVARDQLGEREIIKKILEVLIFFYHIILNK